MGCSGSVLYFLSYFLGAEWGFKLGFPPFAKETHFHICDTSTQVRGNARMFLGFKQSPGFLPQLDPIPDGKPCWSQQKRLPRTPLVACTPTGLASWSLGTPQRGRSGQPCSLPGSAGPPGDSTASSGSPPQQNHRNLALSWARETTQELRQTTHRPGSPVAASQSSCRERIPSTPLGELGERCPHTVIPPHGQNLRG